MRAFWAIGAAMLGLLATAPAIAESRLAFVVGNDAYRNVNPLQKAVNDARSVSRSLQQLGFRVTLGENLAWRDYVEKFSLFENSIRPGDIAFLFYSGHGVEIDGANYLIPVDAPKVSPEQQSLLKDVSISTDGLIQRLKARGTRTQIIVLDACRENPFRLASGRSVGGARGLADARVPGGVFMIYSAGVGEVALDRLSDSDADPNSVFTRSFLPLLAERFARQRLRALARVEGRGEAPSLMLLAHTDVVDARREDWSVDPFKLTERDGYFYGRGTTDIRPLWPSRKSIRSCLASQPAGISSNTAAVTSTCSADSAACANAKRRAVSSSANTSSSNNTGSLPSARNNS